MTLSFLYRAFCRLLQFIRLTCRSDIDLAVEVVKLRDEVAVLRRQVHRPALEPADRAVLAGLAQVLPRRHLGRFFVQPETLLRWRRALVANRWTTRTAGPVDQASRREPTRWSSGWRRKTLTGATAASTASSPPWASSSPPRASGRY